MRNRLHQKWVGKEHFHITPLNCHVEREKKSSSCISSQWGNYCMRSSSLQFLPTDRFLLLVDYKGQGPEAMLLHIHRHDYRPQLQTLCQRAIIRHAYFPPLSLSSSIIPSGHERWQEVPFSFIMVTWETSRTRISGGSLFLCGKPYRSMGKIRGKQSAVAALLAGNFTPVHFSCNQSWKKVNRQLSNNWSI